MDTESNSAPIKWTDLSIDEQRELQFMGLGIKMYYLRFHQLKAKGLCWVDYASNREILTPLGRAVLEQANNNPIDEILESAVNTPDIPYHSPEESKAVRIIGASLHRILFLR